MNVMLEDLTMLTSKRLAKELRRIARDALVCDAVTVFDGNADEGLAVVLHIESDGRGEVLDLARVVEDDSAVEASCAWSLLRPSGKHRDWRLLLRVGFERPVHCEFTVAFAIDDDVTNSFHDALPLIAAADRLVFVFDGSFDPDDPLVWLAAPAAREPVVELLASVNA